MDEYKIMTNIEAMKLALDSLITEANIYIDNDPEDGPPEQMVEAIAALRQAISEYEEYNPDVVFNDDGTFILTLPDGDELRIIPPRPEPDDCCEECGMKYCECGERT